MADILLPEDPETTPGQHGTNFNAPYGGVVLNGRVAPGTRDAIRQAVIAARERRRRLADQPSIANLLRSVGEQPLPPMQAAGRRLSRVGGLILEGLLRGGTDTLDMAAMGPESRALMEVNPWATPEARAASEAPNPALQATDAIHLTHSDYTPPDSASRALLEGSRFLGGGLVPESAIYRYGRRVAARVAAGASEDSLSRTDRIALAYVRQPGRTMAANVTGAAGSVAGGHAAAVINPALEPVGQILGGALGGMAPFAGRGHGTPHDELIPEEPSLANDNPEMAFAHGAVENDNLPVGTGRIPSLREHITAQERPAPSEPVRPNTHSDSPPPPPANDGVSADDPVAPARDQAIREHARTHDLTPAETAEMYWTNENPELTASIRDRTNQIHQESVVAAHEPEVHNPDFLHVDNPGGDWLEGKQRRAEAGAAEAEPESLSGRRLSGATTASTRTPVELPTEALVELPGVNGEHPAPGGVKYDRLHADVSVDGWDPDHPILVMVNHLGEPYIAEGNNRVAVASAHGVPTIKTEVQWRNGAEAVDGPMSPSAVERLHTVPSAARPEPPALPTWEGLPEHDSGGHGSESPREPPSGGRGGGDEPPHEPPAGGHGDDGEPPHPSNGVVKRLTAALNSADRVNKEQEALRHQERRERVAKAAQAQDAVGGEEGVHAALSQLQGEMPKLDFNPVREQFTGEELKSLFDRIRTHPRLLFFEQLRAGVGLKKLLDGQLPNSSELSLLGRVFPQDFIKAALRNRSRTGKILDVAANALNMPRALMASVDLSAPFRQGVFLVGRKEFYKAWPEMFRQFAKGFKNDDAAFEAFMDNIRERPTFHLMDEAKLALSGIDHNLSNREEAFMSPYAERIPVVGRLVRASERAYTAYLNKLRADVFDSLVQLHDDAGIRLEDNPKELGDIGRFINSATGRGSLGKLNSSAPLLNATFFSPRLIKSRLDLLNPVFYATLSPIVRREAIKSLLSFGAIATTVLGLAAAGGMKVETDPRSSDFAKIRNGDVRYDILGGFGQYITLGARLVTNQTKSLDGQVSTLGGRYGARTRLDTTLNFGTNKLAPIPSFVADFLRGKDPAGQPFNLGHAALSRVIPLFVQDIYSVMQDKGPTGALQALPGAFGTGLQVIPPSHAIDRFGRHVADLPQEETDPVPLEVARLTEPNSQLIGTPQRTNVLIGDTRRNLTDEEFQRYQETSGRYILEDIRTEMASPEWKTMSDGDKRDTIRVIVRDQRQNARDELITTPDTPLPDTPTGSGDTPVGDTMLPEDNQTSDAGGFSAARVVESLFPGIHVTQEHRDPNSRLGRANPNSWHNRGRHAVDVRPIRGMSFADYVDTVRQAGYHIIQQRDEVHNPSRWATGPHWHLVIGARA